MDNVDFVLRFGLGLYVMAQTVKNLPAMQEIWVLPLGRENPPGKEMATHSRILAWRIPWTEEPGGLQSMGSPRVGHDWVTDTYTWWAVYPGADNG